VVNLPVSAVNWVATEKYAASARYSHYMATSAESDYAVLAGDVAAVLNRIVLTKEPKARLDMAVDARKRLATWPRDHYGYRADDVREMLGMLDEAISDLRVAAGETSFTIDLVATPQAPPPEHVPLLRAPTPAEAIAQAIAVAKGLRCGIRSALDSPERRCCDRQPEERAPGHMGAADPPMGRSHHG
jgi:hypothetical protein